MTKAEYNDLFDSLSYGHDADLEIAGHRFLLSGMETKLLFTE